MRPAANSGNVFHTITRNGKNSKRIRQELATKKEVLKQIRVIEKEKGTVTLLHLAEDVEHNNAVALK